VGSEMCIRDSAYTDDEIGRILKAGGMNKARLLDDPACETADLLAKGKLVGWFQGGMEIGPRALGGRSILADPRDPDIRDRVNALKGRESWRPLAPSVTEEQARLFFDHPCPSPFMLIAFEANEKARREIPGVVHVDGTVRAQTVSPDVQPRFHALLSAFKERTGVAAVLNTSFNVGPEPIVCTPRDALMTFYSSGLDALVAGSWLLEK